MSIARAFILGLLASLVLVLAVLVGRDLSVAWMLALMALPVVALWTAAVFTPFVGWGSRAFRGVLGAIVAGGLGFAAFLFMKARTDWFHWPDERGGEVFLMFLVAHATIPGGIAAAAATPGRGLALAGGFSLGLAAVYLTGDATNPGLPILLAVGTVGGAAVSAIGRGLANVGSRGARRRS